VADDRVSATTVINASTEAIFAVLADPARHAAIDGTGWVCDALDSKPLVVVSILVATGHNEELKSHLRGALNLGWTVDELREALLQTAPYAGFSASNEALQALSAIATQDAGDGFRSGGVRNPV